MRQIGWSEFRVLVVVLTVSAAFAALGGAPPAAAAGSRTAGPGPAQVAPVPGWAAHARPSGPAPAGQRETVTVFLRQPRAAAAAAYAAAVSDPRSPLYRRFLSPAQYRSRYAPGGASVSTVSTFLRRAGLTVAPVPANHLYVRATGTISQEDRAFSTTSMTYRRGGGTAIAPSKPLLAPAAAAAAIAGVSGMETDPTAMPAPPAMAPAGTVTCSSYAFEHTATLPAAYGRTVFPTQGCGYTPAQVHGAYETSSLLTHGVDGRGVKVAVLLFYPVPTAVSDIDRFSAGHGLPPLAPGQLTEDLPASFNYGPASGCPPVQQVDDEAEGDLESVHNMAPGAHLVYVAAPDCTPEDILATINETVDQHLADIVTNSYELPYAAVPPADAAASHQAFIQAAAEGMGFFYADGDFGDNTPAYGSAQTTWPSSDPFVTAVGGTSLFAGPAGEREGELGWGMTLDPVGTVGGVSSYLLPLPGQFAGGSGGGPSQGFAEPGYQQGVVPPSLVGSDPRRVLPDVAADADLATPVLFGITVNGTYTEAGGGGTSVSSPLFAGLEALADQAAGGPHGFVNPLLYLLHGTPVFHDIVRAPGPVALAVSSGGTTYLDTLQDDTSLTAAPGYDDQTGLGSPDGAAYVAALSVLGHP